jgi:N-methylhydantoinase A
VAQNLGMARAIIAPHAGVFSAFGFSCADIERTRIRGAVRPWAAAVLPELERLFADLCGEALRTSAEWGFAEAEVTVERSVDLRYRRQASELTVALPPGPLTPAVLEEARKTFDEEHEKTFGHSFREGPVEMVSVRLVSRIPRPRPPIEAEKAKEGVRRPAPAASRRAYFGPKTGFVDTPVVQEVLVGAPPREGPLLVDRYDTTVVVPPGCTLSAAPGGSLVIDVGTGGPHA